MNRRRNKTAELGFTLIELLTALGIFLLVCGAAFTLLGSSQQRYQIESQLLTSFQEARLGLDQIVRDVNDSGYPPPTYYNGYFNLSASSPFAWSPTAYPASPCQIGTGGGGTCTTPGDFDLIIETNPNPQDPSSKVQWIRYKLQQTTLMRGIIDKPNMPGDDPAVDTDGQLAPFVQNIMNNAPNVLTSSQFANLQAVYPGMFPTGNPVPVFSYVCDAGGGLLPCPGAVGSNSPQNIREVVVTLIVATPLPDATTGEPRLVQLVGRGRRINPNQ